MLSPSLIKVIVALAACTAVLAGCGMGDPPVISDKAVNFAAPNSLPFAAEEPSTYQLEMIVKAGGTERITRIARAGDRWRIDYDLGSPDQLGSLQSAGHFLIDDRRKVYTETSSRSGRPQAYPVESGLLSRPDARFTELETTGGITKYRVIWDQNTASEIDVYVDNELKIPVKQEFFSLSGAGKELLYSTEIRGFTTIPDESLFAVPVGYKKVAPADFERITTGE